MGGGDCDDDDDCFSLHLLFFGSGSFVDINFCKIIFFCMEIYIKKDLKLVSDTSLLKT